jgi:hypothetical protein
MKGSPVHELLYLSRGLIDLDPQEMELLLGSSRTRNAEAGITGMLLHIHDVASGQVFYLQLLEGPDPDLVEQTYERISRDELHGDLHVLSRGERPQRTFGDWSMLAGTTSVDAALHRITENIEGVSTNTGQIWDLLQDSLIARSLLIVAAAEPQT